MYQVEEIYLGVEWSGFGKIFYCVKQMTGKSECVIHKI